jgi:cell division protease FtsH
VTSFLPDEVRRMQANMEDFSRDLVTAMGGRVAEELRFGEISAGAADDIRQATRIARRMVCEFGMSPKLGPIAYGDDSQMVFLGREISRERNYSEETAATIDGEVSRIVGESYERARKLLSENVKVLETIAAALVEREVLAGEEIEVLVRGGKLAPLAPRQAPGPQAPVIEASKDEEPQTGFPEKLSPQGALGGGST